MNDNNKRPKATMTALGDILLDHSIDNPVKHISREFQDFGYRLAVALDDTKHTALYIKLAKTQDRYILEKAWSFVKDAANVKNKAKLFMWKLKQLKDGL